MREIKFRAWDPEKREMWVPKLIKNSTGQPVTWFPDGTLCTHFHQILMQYTGLKDKNGQEIVEGDILRVRGWNQIEYIATMEHLSVDGSDDMGTNMIGFPRFDDSDQPEVIGNIYENPDLLTEGARI